MFGRSNVCVAEPRERVAVPAECQFGRPAEKKGDLLAFCLSDMRKIKSNLVIFVTDNFLLLSIVGNTVFFRAGGKNGGVAAPHQAGAPVRPRMTIVASAPPVPPTHSRAITRV